jgi:hypothetical protein
MRHLSAAAAALLIALWSHAVLPSEEHPPCSVWTEEIDVVANKGWRLEKPLARRVAPRRPPADEGKKRSAEIVSFEKLGVEIESNDPKPDAHKMYRAHSRFAVRFKKLPCSD